MQKLSKDLHWSVVERPQKKKPEITETDTDTFLRFYSEELKGKFAGTRTDLNDLYFAWLKKNGGLKAINRNKIKKILNQLGIAPKRRSMGMWYSFLCKE